eukprot:JZ548876.1.p1 GENE.JZ548876.1~~JZ548876.1.p1  ORF type:complete len:196 (+),score=25.62 JZ548876.1:103-690(+)
MGNLFSSYMKNKPPVDIMVDFQNAEPASDSERAVYDEVQQTLDHTSTFLISLRNYKGATELMRKAISFPASEEANEAAWEGILLQVDVLKQYYDFSKQITDALIRLLNEMMRYDSDTKSALETQQALARQIARVFDYALTFDETKMTNPDLMNDFSFYRRQVNRFKRTTSAGLLSDDESQPCPCSLHSPTPSPKR